MAKKRSRAAMMTAALAVAGGMSVASAALADERGATADQDRAVEGGEGSGEGVEEAVENCRPGSCPIPLYGVWPIDGLDPNVEGPAPEDGDTTESATPRR